jgi:acyl-CoA reductase-like NAD-dependent aldehyde dehydrogenase
MSIDRLRFDGQAAIAAGTPAARSALSRAAETGTEPPAWQILEAIDPATRVRFGSVFVTSPASIPALVARSRAAALAWRALPAATRATALSGLRELIARQAHEIAETIGRGMGKPLVEALALEVSAVLDALDTLADPDRTPRSPHAVACVIAPVSMPFERAMTPAVLALAAGTAVIVKPSSAVPLVGVLIERLFNAAFAAFPGLAQVVFGSGDLGARLATAAGVESVVFTGSTPVGRELQAALAPLQRPALLDLGGIVAMIVCDDANLERAASAAVFGRFSNNGQDCASINRVYVQRAVVDAFTHKVVRKVWALKRGPCTDPFCAIGPLASGRGLETLRALLQDALDRRASMIAGGFPVHVTGPDHGERRGADRLGWYWPPTVVVNADHSMRVMSEPVFGPILPIQPVDDEGQAIALANDAGCRLDACVFSGDRSRAELIASKLRAGSVAVNDLPGSLARPRSGDRDNEPDWFPYNAARLLAVGQALLARIGA